MIYSPAGEECRQWKTAALPNGLRLDDDLDKDLQRIANSSHRYSKSDQQVGDDVDTNIEFRANDELTFTSHLSLVLITILHVCQLGLFVKVLQLIYLSSKSK